ncbi:MAG: methionine gamma-lyase family protein [Clostridia bacterium]|nr:methionine gamma-lyase family protein [Clostridia bacterium]
MKYENLIKGVEERYARKYNEIDEISLKNQEKVLNAFTATRVSSRHFAPSTGYGYGDDGRDKLSELFACVFNAESALVSPHFASGTHTISCALFGIFRPGDKVLAITGEPYDTLMGVIFGKGNGSLSDFGIKFECVPLLNGSIDYKTIAENYDLDQFNGIYIQRSPGYTRRKGFSINDIAEAVQFVKNRTDAPIIIDNCYGEFVETREPTDVGADLIIGSLIKNPGGALAPTGGYVAGKKDLVDKVAMRLTAPGVGAEVGSYEHSYRNFYQGLFIAPHVVAQARKGGLLVAGVMEELGYGVFPSAKEDAGDIVRVIDFGNEEKMIKFCQSIQSASPVDGFALPMPWDMPGYEDQVIMAAGTFVQGSSIELSADAPVRPPYSLYVQGGITYEHTKIALLKSLQSLDES